MIAHIEAFHSILEDECYSRYEFDSFLEVYREVAEYMEYYNTRRRHGSLKYMSPNNFYQAFLDEVADLEPFSHSRHDYLFYSNGYPNTTQSYGFMQYINI